MILVAGRSSRAQDYGCYIVDRRGQGVEESVNQLVRHLLPKHRADR